MDFRVLLSISAFPLVAHLATSVLHDRHGFSGGGVAHNVTGPLVLGVATEFCDCAFDVFCMSVEGL